MRADLEQLTSETFKEIQHLEIVLPEIYKDIFYTKAKQNNIKIDLDDKEEALIYALKKIQQVEKQTQESTHLLKTSVKNAQKALEQNDAKKLALIQKTMEELEAKIDKLQSELLQDDLTTVYNRRWLFNNFLNNELLQQSGTLAFIDIDDFKNINDDYGHLIGDKVLKLIAQTLKRIEDSVVVRYAGDEFLLISPAASLTKIEEKLLTILKNLESTGLKSENHVFTVSFSYGLVEFNEKDNIKKVIEQADNNMYHYKNSKE